MNMSRWEICLYPRESGFARPAGMRAAVSLHSHSDCSRETLEFIPAIARRIPIVADCFERSIRVYQNKYGRPLDFGEWYWRPPLPAAAVIDSEVSHLGQRLDLPGLVSLTDHDTVEGPSTLRANGRTDVPLSFEWSVPFQGSMFHLGVHGISAASIDGMMRALTAYTAGPASSIQKLEELLEWLAECRETFIILNHPCWDLASVGQLRHDSALLAFLRTYRDRIHGLELNGYRSWAENRDVLPLASGFGIPVVGGGDRHGLSPNTIVNMTRAEDLAGFADELRVERSSHCVVFPEYTEPFVARILQSAAEILGPLDGHHRGQTTWPERVFITTNGVEHAVESMWKRQPLWLRSVVAITRAMGWKPFGALFELRRLDGYQTLETDCQWETVSDVVPRLTADSAAA
jgi:hypothetical protein